MSLPLYDEIVALAKADALMLFQAVREDTARKASEVRKVREDWKQRLGTSDPAELAETLADLELNGIPSDEVAAWFAGRVE